jgi:Site-specific recombinase XerD
MGKGGSGKRYPGVEARGNSIRIRFNYRGRRSETLKLEPSTANLSYVNKLRGEILRKIEIGTFSYAEYFPESKFATKDKPKAQTFKKLSEVMLETSDIATSTRYGYRKSLKRYAWPAFGETPVDQISELDILKALAGVKGKTRNNTLLPIRRTFALAKLKDDPTAEINYVRHQTPDPDPFEPEEVEAILNKMRELYGEEVENYFGVGFFTGARPSEAIAALWGDISLKDQSWHISRAKVLKEEKGTKTHKARDHELSSRAMYYVEKQRAKTQLRGATVFLDPVTGKPYNDDKPPRERYWRPVLTLLKMRYREPYQMRHTYITMAIMAGANPVYVARQAGNSPRVIFKHYAKWIEGADRSRERQKIEHALGQIWGKAPGELRGKAGGSTERNGGAS